MLAYALVPLEDSIHLRKSKPVLLAIEKGEPKIIDENVEMKYGAKAIMAFFLVTIATAVCFHNFLYLPPVAGMMLGLGFIGPLSYHIKLHEGRSERYDYIEGAYVIQGMMMKSASAPVTVKGSKMSEV